MDDDQLKRLKVLVTPAAWTAHEALPAGERVDVDLAFDVYGDLYLVAAAVLENVCLKARELAAAAPAQAKKIKVGKIELERAQGGSVSVVQADAWCALALRWRDAAAGSGVPGPVFTELCP